MHLTATSFTGYGISKYLVGDESFVVVIKYYILAVLIHAAWNAAAVTGSPFILLFSIVLAIGGLEFSKRRIRELFLQMQNNSSSDFDDSDEEEVVEIAVVGVGVAKVV